MSNITDFKAIPQNILFLSDSLINIQRLRRQNRQRNDLDTYEQNRILDIRNRCSSIKTNWLFHHISGSINPADYPSRLGSEELDLTPVLSTIGNIINSPEKVSPEDTKAYRYNHNPKLSNSESADEDTDYPGIKRELLLAQVQPLDVDTDYLDIKRQLLLAQVESSIGDGITLAMHQNRVIVPDTVSTSVVEYIHRAAGHFGQIKLKQEEVFTNF